MMIGFALWFVREKRLVHGISENIQFPPFLETRRMHRESFSDDLLGIRLWAGGGGYSALEGTLGGR
jgi:hypothetical protein